MTNNGVNDLGVEEHDEGVVLKMPAKSVVEEEAHEEVQGEVASVPEEVVEPAETTEEEMMIVRVGDIFVYSNNVIALTVLNVSRPTDVGKIYRVRLYSSVEDSIDVNEEMLMKYIANEQLVKLNTRRDQIEAVAKKMIFKTGNVFTRDGQPFLEILSDVLLYIDANGKPYDVVGTRNLNDVVAFRNVVDVVSEVYGNSDQFPPQV